MNHMLETILRLYSMAMAVGVRSPLPHLFGPPGCGKSTTVEQLAQIVGKRLHITNVSRISPLEIEGVEMPHSTEEDMRLRLLHSRRWTELRDGDILLLDEFLRGFPEVYNGLLDIITSRQVGGYQLPKVFIIAASNSTVSYDTALEDRLLHLPVPDPRSSKRAKAHLADMIVEQLGLLPDMAKSHEMQSLLDTEVLPMFEMLDSLKNKSSAPASTKGRSVRNLIGQAQLRQVQSPALAELIKFNNARAVRDAKWQFVFLLDGKDVRQHGLQAYEDRARQLVGNDRLSPIQAMNLDLNLQLLEMEAIRHEKGTDQDDDVINDDPFLAV